MIIQKQHHRARVVKIGAKNDTEADFRELTTPEMWSHSFSDYFRFSFTARMDRDQALAFARKLEVMLGDEMPGDTRVYVGVRNRGG